MLPIRLRLLPAVLLLSACGGLPAVSQPTSAPPILPTAVVVRATAITAPSAALIDRPILVDRAAPTATPGAAQAAPTPQPSPRAVEHDAATRIVIDDIALDRPLIPVGLDADTMPIVPKHDPGWYVQSAAPGQGDNVVIWGHALRFRDSPDIPAPFGRLNQLKPGASIVLYDTGGASHAYTITQQVWATPDQVEYILPKGKEQVTLVSCIGDQVLASDGSVVNMTHRLITIAEPKG